ncbi:MAG TPA: metal-dependent transcriptional regulator [Fastidiosipila sp.]|nr:metal-dependent transcriptional regulator [Fastidiosipila sp.]
MRRSESQEDYLEQILMLQKKNGHVRSIDIAEAMGVTKPSVSQAMKLLRENELIEMGEDNLITLTSSGHALASKILNRHQQLAKFFISLGVPEDIAFKDACLIEHDISPETFRAICKLSGGKNCEEE